MTVKVMAPFLTMPDFRNDPISWNDWITTDVLCDKRVGPVLLNQLVSYFSKIEIKNKTYISHNSTRIVEGKYVAFG
jgi:hypothetical protein